MDLPCCCLLPMQGSWVEYLVLEKLKDRHWLCVDVDWCFKELGYFESAAAQAFGHQKCRFGKLDDAQRFGDSDLQSDQILCFFLRTTAKGEPLPSLREGSGLRRVSFSFQIGLHDCFPHQPCKHVAAEVNGSSRVLSISRARACNPSILGAKGADYCIRRTSRQTEFSLRYNK